MRFIIFIVFLSLSASLTAQTIRGKVQDAHTGEDITGATIILGEQPTKGVISGLDGSFSINGITKFPATLVVSFVGYTSQEIIVENGANIVVKLEEDQLSISEVVVIGENSGRTDNSARSIEKFSMNVMNVVSARSIEISPDMTVGNVISRVSGVTVERSSSGEGQYALLRGMDKRYNYTLVNGVKIPSPDNKNRFVPLDIFPSELLDRLEVTKALTADMEGDGIGGAINMVMKDAPTSTQFTANLSTGYNSMFFNRDFQSFNYKLIDRSSPLEKYGMGYESIVKMQDFTSENLRLKSGRALPNVAGGFSYGKRFFRQKIGLMLAASYSNTLRGTASDIYSSVIEVEDGKQAINKRYFSTQQIRLGTHAKVDFNIAAGHKLLWYNAYMDFGTMQVRDAYSTKNHTVRMRYNHQSIYNTTLKGLHEIVRANNDLPLRLDWSLNYGSAFNETPDNVILTSLVQSVESIQQDPGATRRWEHNSDKDMAVYVNVLFTQKIGQSTLDLSGGGMFRDKNRESYFDIYTFRPFDPAKEPNPRELVKGVDWNNYNEVKFDFKGVDPTDPLNNNATERIGAGYIHSKLTIDRLQIIAGLRFEHTEQGYDLTHESPVAKSSSRQVYGDFLPSVHLKYGIHTNANLRLSYYKAINRPSFFEILPYQMVFDDYTERGNPELRRAIAQNIDLRYELFPRSSEQMMVGVFYKNITDPIEYGFVQQGSATYYSPVNNGMAYNYGVEVDFIKYFKWIGLKANYTFTQSQITTSKKLYVQESDDPDRTSSVPTVTQTRPLYGQAAHVANLSLLLHAPRSGWDAQLSVSYTGSRLVVVSQFFNDDMYQSGYFPMDASAEKRFRNGITVFGKASNLLNSRMAQYVKINKMNEMRDPRLAMHGGGVLDRREQYWQNFTIGIKYKF